MSVKVHDVYWLAGFLEGEGYFGKPNVPLFVAVDSTDEDAIARTASMFDVRVYGPYTNGVSKKGVANKPKYRAQVSGHRAAGWMMTLYPLMCDRRRGQIKSCLSAWRERPIYRGDRTHCLRGHSLSGSNLYVNPRGERSCRACFSRAARQARKLPTTPGNGKTNSSARAEC